MKSIILIGYMCAGKTTVGKAFAKQLGYSFYDLDWYIEGRFRKRISEIFAERGEKGFRELERNMLHEVVEFEDIVLSCGGGTPCFYDNIDYMNSVGDTVFLQASVDTILAHLKLSHTVRPLLQGKSGPELREYISAQMQERLPYYERAAYVVDVNVLDNYTKINYIVSQILQALNLSDGKIEN